MQSGEGGIRVVHIRHRHGSSCAIHLQRGHIISWKKPDGRELLFLSKASWFRKDKPIRGGVALHFPQCANLSNMKKSQGFAYRSDAWIMRVRPTA